MYSVLTIATGKKLYINMALHLARSFLYWHKGSNIKFYLVTDQPQSIPENIKSQISIIDITLGDYGDGFSTKLYIDHFSPTKYTLFIDADCLIYGCLQPVFDQFKGNSVSAIGDTLTEGDFFCDVASILQKLKLNYMPRFVGGVYYIEKNEISSGVFNYARQLLPEYDALNMIRLRGKENEEPLIALGMAAYNQKPIEENGTIKADRMFYNYLSSNILTGKVRLWNIDNNFPANAYYRILTSFPKIVHFNASFAENFEYNSECQRLFLTIDNKLPIRFINIYVKLFFVMPAKGLLFIKNKLRPYYKLLFGVRKVKKSKRL